MSTEKQAEGSSLGSASSDQPSTEQESSSNEINDYPGQTALLQHSSSDNSGRNVADSSGHKNRGDNSIAATNDSAGHSVPQDRNQALPSYATNNLRAMPLPSFASSNAASPAPQPNFNLNAQLSQALLAALGAQQPASTGLTGGASSNVPTPSQNAPGYSSEQLVAMQLLGLVTIAFALSAAPPQNHQQPQQQPTPVPQQHLPAPLPMNPFAFAMNNHAQPSQNPTFPMANSFDASIWIALFAAFLRQQQQQPQPAFPVNNPFAHLGINSIMPPNLFFPAASPPLGLATQQSASTGFQPTAQPAARSNLPTSVPVAPKPQVAAIPPRRRRKYHHESFPEKLHRLIIEAESQGKGHIIRFLPAGDRFEVLSTHAFEAELLSKYFRTKQASSFKRLLRMYGFRKVRGTWLQGTFHHPLFHRDYPEFCQQMERVGSNKDNNAEEEDKKPSAEP